MLAVAVVEVRKIGRCGVGCVRGFGRGDAGVDYGSYDA